MEKAILIGIITQNQPEKVAIESINELEFLALTAGAKTEKKVLQKMLKQNGKTFIGKGKITELKSIVQSEKIDMVIFDDELSPSQLRNVEQILNCKILDRTNLILDIFAFRASTAYSRTQVELAQYQYLLPRLTNLWTHLSKQKGGIGMKGPGETEIETDRRVIRKKISLLKSQLKKIDVQMETQRKNRKDMIRVSLVGYTNVGKSTLMNIISKSKVLAENKLFATLDTKMKKVVINNTPFLLSDTVGFIRKLPTQLVESFKSTLDEVRESDILVHVVDISNPNFEEHMRSVNETLKDLKVLNKPQITVFNKIDLFSYTKKDNDDLSEWEFKNYDLNYWEKTWMKKTNNNSVFVSAINKKSLKKFRELLFNKVCEAQSIRYPYKTIKY
ncbi:GTPase HflX [Bacteroidota bacterium]|nr:GTPase HflX [Bacteroidota bacterium]